MGNTTSNISEQSEEEDPTEATLIYETKNVKDTSTDDTIQNNDANKTVYSESSKVEKSSCWNEIDIEYFQRYQSEFEQGPKCRHFTFQHNCSDCEIYSEFIVKKDHFCPDCNQGARRIRLQLSKPSKQPIVVALKDMTGDLAYV